ncbi:MAG: hypothetical protein LBP75_09860 [Planctomycetota bacterium]|nr:hypothetical protein [Planctomycetota bacterium]
MIATALLGTARRHTDTARAVKHADILQLALFSAKADANYTLSDPRSAAAPALKQAFNTITDTLFVYNADATDTEITGGGVNLSVNEFATAIEGNRTYDFYRKNAESFDRKLQKLQPSEPPFYAVKTRTFVVPLDAAFLLDYVYKTDGAYPFPGLFDGEAALAKNIVPLYTDVFVGRNAKTLEIPVVTYPPSYTLPDRYMVTVGYEYTETKAGGTSNFNKATVHWGNPITTDETNQFKLGWAGTGETTLLELGASNDTSLTPLRGILGAFTGDIVLLPNGSQTPSLESLRGATLHINSNGYAEVLRLLRNAAREKIRADTRTPVSLTPKHFDFFVSTYNPPKSGSLTNPPEGGSFADDPAATHYYPEYVRYTTAENGCMTYKTVDDTRIYYVPTGYDLGKLRTAVRNDSDTVYSFTFNEGTYPPTVSAGTLTLNTYGDWDMTTTLNSLLNNPIRLSFGATSDYNLVRGVIKKADATTATFGPYEDNANAINNASDKLARISQMLDTLDNRDYYLGKAGYWNDANTLKFNSVFSTVDSTIGSILSPSQLLNGGAGVTGLLGSGAAGNLTAVRDAPFYAASVLDGVIDYNTTFAYWYDNGGEALLTGATLNYANQSAKLNAATPASLNISFPPALGGAKAVLGKVTLNVAQNSVVPGETIQPDPITEIIEVQIGGSEAQLDDYVTLKAGLPEDDRYFSAAVDYIAMNNRAGTPSTDIPYNIVNKIKNVANFYLNDSLTGVSGELASASYIDIDAQNTIRYAATDANNLGGKNLLGTPLAPYAPMADLIHLTKQTTDAQTLYKIDAARILANPPRRSGNANYVADFKQESLIVGMNATPNADTLAHKYANYQSGKIKAELIYRDSYSSFGELGINVLGLREANEQQVDKVLTSSLGFNMKSFADAKLFQSKCDADAAHATDCGNPAAVDNQGDRRYPLKYIPLNTATPKWLIAAAVGWQLFNSPTAKLRRSSLLANADEGGAIYRIDYASATGGAYVFDQRLLYDKNGPRVTGGNILSDAELIITPYGYTTPANTVISNAGHGNYYGFPLKYRGDIACPSGDNVNAVKWKGWDGTTSLDLLAFAPGTSNSYAANGATPFKKDTGDILPANKFDDFVDVRTNTFAGTGTYVRPAFPGGNYEVIDVGNPADSILSSDERYNGRLAIYGNSLRVHGELARIVEIIDILKDGELHADKFEDYGGAVGDTIGNIVKAIYRDRQVGYEIGAPTSRTVLARNPFEGTVIWARNPDLNVNDYKPVVWTTDATPDWNGWRTNPPSQGANADAPMPHFHPTDPATNPIFSFAPAQSGAGFTADRYIETFMDSGVSYRANSQSGGKKYADGGNYTSGDWQSLVVDNTAVDWDGAALNLLSGANFGYYNLVSYDKESKFQDDYFQKGKPYASATLYTFNNGSDGTGSNVQGYDGQTNGHYAEPVWYSTGDAMAPPANSSLVFGDNYRSGPVIYCDREGDVNTGTYNRGGNAAVRTLTAPPYQTGTGRWDDRGGGNAPDAPLYKTVNNEFGYGSASSYKTDPSKNGTLYRNDSTKKIAQWRWNWGKWDELPDAPVKGANLYTFVKDDSLPGLRKVLTPDCDDTQSASGCVTKHAAIAGSSGWAWGDKAYRYLRYRIDGYTHSDNVVNAYLYDHVNGGNHAYNQEEYSFATNPVTFNKLKYRFGANDFSEYHYKHTVTQNVNYGWGMTQITTTVYSDSENLTGSTGKVTGTAGTRGTPGTPNRVPLGEFYAPAADAGANIVGAGSLAMLSGNQTYVDGDGQVTDKDHAYVGRFVMRQATAHRWRPAIGSVYPMYLEINPQAIKNAAIERVVVNLFGAEVYSQGAAHTDANNLIRTDYLLPHNLVAKKAELQRTHDDATPVFSPEPTDKYFRVIVAAGLVHEPRQTVVAQRFLQYIYRVAADGRASVVDQHFFEPE